jgi:hypothetical protein
VASTAGKTAAPTQVLQNMHTVFLASLQPVKTLCPHPPPMCENVITQGNSCTATCTGWACTRGRTGNGMR